MPELRNAVADMTSDRRSYDEGGQEVADSTAGASGDADLVKEGLIRLLRNAQSDLTLAKMALEDVIDHLEKDDVRSAQL